MSTSVLLGQVDKYKHRSLYVDNFANILGSNNSEKNLFEFAAQHEITELILYDLNKVNQRFWLGDSTKNQVLADFIVEAKTKYGIKRISASGESGIFFIEAIHPYNVSRKNKIERFDIYNLEYEYWNYPQSVPGGYYCETYLKNAQLKCNRKNSFKYYIQSLDVMRMLADELDHDIKVEAYIGNFKKSEVKKIILHVDRLLVHDYVKREERLFEYVEQRLHHLEDAKANIEISILYSMESRYLGKYLLDHPSFYEAEKKFFQFLNKWDSDLDEHLKFRGFTYYNYSHFRYAENIKY
ncbi:MAG: hypothetical protein CMB99_09120 [Flavobacteriaceae bacterium]|nr:hypothetical protein [Flavobacteriaceae bacterium]|tara:strand:+ start:513338 stop:514225 length:888 start_codon:yes stop_codon:yes gene_type:complete